MTGVLKSDLLVNAAAAPATASWMAGEADRARGIAQRRSGERGLFSKLFASLRTARARRATLRELSRLDAAALRDIGLEPGTLVETVDAVIEQRAASYQSDNHKALSQVGRSGRKNARGMDELQRLNDRLLSDIGVSRADLEANIVDQRVAVANRNRAFFRAA